VIMTRAPAINAPMYRRRGLEGVWSKYTIVNVPS
jgi:hypothetical protein